MMLMRREEAERRGLPIMASLRSFAAVGVPVCGERWGVAWL